MDTETTSCVVCGSFDFVLRFQVNDWALELPGEFQIVTCQTCGHIYQNPRPTQPEINAYYPEEYQPFQRAISQAPRRWTRAWKHFQWRTRCLQIKRLGVQGGLLDVGAATGIFLNEMRRYGDWVLAGVELNRAAAQYARDTFGLEIFTGQIEQAPWRDGSFDIVTMWDVLEHLPNPRTALLKLRRFLTDQGWLIFSIPNSHSVDARLFGKYWIGLDPPRHLSVFTESSLERLLAETGLEVERIYCFYGRYTAFALSVQQWLHAHMQKSPLRRRIEKILFLPVWRWLTLPYFWVLDQLGLGAILTVRARPKMIQ